METNITLSVRCAFSGGIFLPGNGPARQMGKKQRGKVVICGLTGTTKLRTTFLPPEQKHGGKSGRKTEKCNAFQLKTAASLSLAGKRDKISYVIKLNFVIPGTWMRWASKVRIQDSFFFCGKLKQTIEQTPTRTTFHDFFSFFLLSLLNHYEGKGKTGELGEIHTKLNLIKFSPEQPVPGCGSCWRDVRKLPQPCWLTWCVASRDRE